MVQNLNLLNYNHHKIFKYTDFVPTYYISVINFDAALFFNVLIYSILCLN